MRERIEHDNTPALESRPANGDCRRALTVGRSLFPSDAVARIFKPGRSAMTSGKARTKDWRLVFERRTAPYIEPLMGWTGGDDTLTQVELNFPTLETAIAYAERQGLAYAVERGDQSNPADGRDLAHRRRAFSDATLNRLGLGTLQESYGQAMAANCGASIAAAPETDTGAMSVANDPNLTLDDKRSILMNWAWDAYLIDQAIGERTPENGCRSRLHEVELALLALEKSVTSRAASAVPTAQIAA